MEEDADRFGKLLEKAKLVLDARDKAGSLRIFRFLEGARDRLRAWERDGDEPR